MSPKMIVKLAIAFVLLLALVVGLHFLQKPKGPEKPLAPLNISELKTVRLQQLGGKKLEFSQENGVWGLTEPFAAPLDQTRVSQLLENLKKLELDEAITENPEKQVLYQVDEASGTRVTLYRSGTSEPLADFYMGKEAGDWSHFYHRVHGENAIRISKGFPPYSINQNLSSWQDLTFVKVNPDSVTAMDFKTGGKSYELVKSSEQWTRAGKPVSNEWAKTLLNLSSSLNADELVESSSTLKSTGLEKPTLVFTLTTGTDSVKALFGSSHDGKTYSQHPGSPLLYRLQDSKLTPIKDKLKELK